MSYSQTNTSINVSHFAGLVIGPKGETIKSLKEKHQLKSCYIKNDSLILSGPGSANAKREVIALIKQKKLENRQRMDRNLLLAEANNQRKKQMKIDRKIQAETRLEAMVQSRIGTTEQPTYTYNGKFSFDSEDESDEPVDEPVETKQSTNPKPKKELERNRHGKVLWSEICDEESETDEEK